MPNETVMELVPIARTVEPREISEPEAVIGGAPGVKVAPATDIPVESS